MMMTMHLGIGGDLTRMRTPAFIYIRSNAGGQMSW